ncbi:uncharacterized protein H6S33_009352 [Morchella sextelata]|uniref:uncharacterized protein n=1 Tax=Morchella sextelata TaxID=1174677 RepID=UPI001D05BF3A|nr:uncharacterized protein H6S33_009352 [Morchella sextelata]KAH0612972.1 hypothetical protein H6S33_009352 [Morchella sextelata]
MPQATKLRWHPAVNPLLTKLLLAAPPVKMKPSTPTPPLKMKPLAPNPQPNESAAHHISAGISTDNKAKHMRNPRVHLINAARHDPLNPDRQAILMTITAYTKEPTPSFEAGKITFWFSLSIPYRKDLLIQLVELGVIEYTGWKLSDPPALEVRLLLRGDQCSRPCCGCGNWEQLDEPDKETGKRRYSRLLRCSGCLQCFFCSKECQTLHWEDHSKYCGVIRQAYGDSLVY